MFACRVLRQRRVINLRFICTLSKHCQQSLPEDIQTNFIPLNTTKIEPSKKSLVKELCLHRLREELIPYPEAQTYTRYKDFVQWLQPLEDYILQCVEDGNVKKEDILSMLKTHGVFRACIHENYGGIELIETEITKLIETVSLIPWLGIYLAQNSILPARFISKYGTSEQKNKYLRKMAAGEYITSICVLEDTNEIITRSMKSTAVLSNDNTWKLNGQKVLVINGTDANLFMVFVKHVLPDQSPTAKNISVMLIERDFGGITCSNVEKISNLSEVSTCTVTFEDTAIPKENIIHSPDEKNNLVLLQEVLSPGKQNMAGVAIAILKKFLQMLTTEVINITYMDRNMHEYNYIKNKIGNLILSLYRMESSLYYTAGLVDVFEEQDTELERLIVEKYCVEQCARCIHDGLHLIGVQSHLKKFPYIQMLEDALTLSTFFTNKMDADLNIGMQAIKYVCQNLDMSQIQIRKPLKYPAAVFKNIFKRNSKEILYIKDNLHPSLEKSSEHLEYAIKQLNQYILDIIAEYGLDIYSHQEHISKLTEVMTHVYVVLACLSRSSRAYCLGFKDANSERILADETADRLYECVFEHIDTVQNISISDNLRCKITDNLYKNKGYFVSSSLIIQ